MLLRAAQFFAVGCLASGLGHSLTIHLVSPDLRKERQVDRDCKSLQCTAFSCVPGCMSTMVVV